MLVGGFAAACPTKQGRGGSENIFRAQALNPENLLTRFVMARKASERDPLGGYSTRFLTRVATQAEYSQGDGSSETQRTESRTPGPKTPNLLRHEVRGLGVGLHSSSSPPGPLPIH